ncbi:MAG: GNAT family N-acetyltransferase [Candidatus Hodarchaeales archaeon]|jgi:predicted N-acetyltransferase YhbS
MQYRLMTKDDLKRVAELDRREVIDAVYYYRDGALDLVQEHWDVPEWSSREKQQKIDVLREIHKRGGIIFGAFDESNVAGVIALDSEYIGWNNDQLNLAELFVSKGYRKMGVGKRLVALVKQKAREIGAKKLYVSATPSQNTVHFYLKRGFRLAQEVNPKLFELEPEDIHMELEL